MANRSKGILFAVIVLLSLLHVGRGQSCQFDDITATVLTIHQGNTYHGYIEYRVLLENHNPRASRRVTLVYPSEAWSSGNCLGRLSRTVELPPATRTVVSLPQPPLKVYGTDSVRVEVNGTKVGEIELYNNPEYQGDLFTYYSSMPLTTTILISRSLDHSAAESVFQIQKGAFSPAMATGAPDSKQSAARALTAWMPDWSTGGPHWIELDYDPPLVANLVRIYYTGSASSIRGTVSLISGAGTNVGVI